MLNIENLSGFKVYNTVTGLTGKFIPGNPVFLKI